MPWKDLVTCTTHSPFRDKSLRYPEPTELTLSLCIRLVDYPFQSYISILSHPSEYTPHQIFSVRQFEYGPAFIVYLNLNLLQRTERTTPNSEPKTPPCQNDSVSKNLGFVSRVRGTVLREWRKEYIRRHMSRSWPFNLTWKMKLTPSSRSSGTLLFSEIVLREYGRSGQMKWSYPHGPMSYGIMVFYWSWRLLIWSFINSL